MLLSSILSTRRTLFNISYKADLVMMNSLSFCLRKSIFTSFIKDSFARCSILGWQVFLCVCVCVLLVFMYLTFSWLASFLLRNLLIALWGYHYVWWVTCLLMLSKLFYILFLVIWTLRFVLSSYSQSWWLVSCEFLFGTELIFLDLNLIDLNWSMYFFPKRIFLYFCWKLSCT